MPDTTTTTTLQRAVMAALADNPIVHADEIAVQVLDGSGDIVLRGTVGSPIQRAEAVRAAAAVRGVRHVEDGLGVHVMGIDGRTDSDTDAIGRAAIVGADAITVTVSDNDVTLTGTGGSVEHRDAALRAAEGAPGVAAVHDALTLRGRGMC